MNDEQLDDLKQFIDGRISQAELALKGEVGEVRQALHKLTGEVHELRDEMRDGFSGVGEAVEQMNQHAGEHDKEVDRRLTSLEHQIAA